MELGVEGEVLGGGQRGLQGVLVAEKAQAAGVGLGLGQGVGAVPQQAALGEGDEAGQHPQEGRLSRPVGAGEQQGLAGGDVEGQAGEDQAFRPPAGQISRLQRGTLHQRPHEPQPGGRAVMDHTPSPCLKARRKSEDDFPCA
jgi:hypothetical protein